MEMARLNNETAVLVYAAGELDTVSYFTVDDRGITAIHFIRSPYKLADI
jgi:hypothetical protein